MVKRCPHHLRRIVPILFIFAMLAVPADPALSQSGSIAFLGRVAPGSAHQVVTFTDSVLLPVPRAFSGRLILRSDSGEHLAFGKVKLPGDPARYIHAPLAGKGHQYLRLCASQGCQAYAILQAR